MRKLLRQLRLLPAMCLLLLPALGWAQVQVNVTVTPPYSGYLKDYIKDGSNVLISLSNVSGQPQTVKLISSLTGDNGVKISVKDSYMPPAPIVLAPNETKLITQNGLKVFNSNLSEGDVFHQGITQAQVLQGGKLPEGVYQLCMKAMTFSPAPTALGNVGCGSFSVLFYDPPILMNPTKEAVINSQQPQLIPFSWSPSGVAGKTKYSLRIVDLTATGVFNANDAFLNDAIFPFFKQDNIPTNAYIYDMGKPKLLENHKYAVQIVASDPQGKLQYKNGGRSEVQTFSYQKTGMQLAPPSPPPGATQGGMQNTNLDISPDQGNFPDPPAGPCNSNTQYAGQIDGAQKNGIPNGTDIAVGKFVMRNTKFTKSSGSYDGTGEIKVNFLNARVLVEFKGITINAANRFAGGTITGKVTSYSVIDQGMSSVKTGMLEKVPDMDALMGYLEKGTRQVNKMNPAKVPVDLPLNFKKEDFNIGIVGIIFEPKEAFVNAVLNTPIPQIYGDDYLLLSAKGVAIHPNGYGGPEMKLALAKDRSVKLSNGVSLTFKGGADNTFATFDCAGFKTISMDGTYTFSRELMLPVDNAGKVKGGNEQVQVAFKVVAMPNLKEALYTGLAFSSRFAIPQAQDFIFSAAGITLDLSESINGADFKAAYPGKKGDWTGIFLKEVSLTLPDYLKGGGNKPLTLAVAKATADKAGFQGAFSVSGDLLKGGSLAGLGLSIESFVLNITNSGITGGGIGGSVKLPLGDHTEVGFGASISAGGSGGANVKFNVTPAADIEANLFLAQLKIIKGSTIGIGKKEGVFTASAMLNGEIGVGFTKKPANSNIGKVNIPSLKFQELSIVSTEGGGMPDFNIAFVQLQNLNVQAKIGGAFEVNLKDLAFKPATGNSKGVGLSFGLGLSILGGEAKESNGFGVTTGLTIRALYDSKKRSFQYDRTKLDSISVKANLGVATLAGTINIYDEDETYGNGFRGALQATVKGVDVEVAIVAQFGRTLPAKGDFKYWYFDAMVDMGTTGIPIPGTVASFYGFGGGAWSNMSASGGSDKIAPGEYKPKNGGAGAAPTRSGVKFVPAANDGGFKAAVLFGLSGSRDAFNGDLTFTMKFDTKKLSVDELSLVGNAYLMQGFEDVSKRNKDAFVHAGAEIYINIPKRIFSGNFLAEIKVGEIIKGSGELAIEFDRPDQGQQGKTKWFVKVGSWTPGADPFEDKARLNATIGFDAKVAEVKVTFQAYFMVGNNLAFGLPPLPNEIYALLKDDGVAKKKPMPTVVADEVNLAFAFGAGLKLTAGFDFFIISANLLAMAGFDALLANAKATCNGKEAGFNGWYAKGQAYAMLQGDMKLFRKIPVASFVAGAVLQFMGPNPNYISGDIVAYIDILGHSAGEYHGHFQKGETCLNLKTEFNPFENLKLIKYTSPAKVAGGQKGVDPFTKLTVKFAYRYPSPYRTNMYMFDAFNNKQITYEFVPTIKLLDSKGYEVPVRIEPVIYHEELVNIYPKQTLNEKSTYKLVVDAYVTGPNNKSEKHEQVIAAFTTAAYPDYIHMDDLTDAYPVPMQRYAMATRIVEGGQQSLKGHFTFNRNLDYFTKKYKPTHNIVVRFTDVATGNAVASASPTEFDDKLSFPMPQNLMGSTIYHVGVYMTPKTGLLEGNINNLALNNTGERIIFAGYYFRTSKYRSFKDKFAKYEVKKVGYIPEMADESMMEYTLGNTDGTNKDYYSAVLLMQGDEPIDAAEYNGYIKDGNKDVIHAYGSPDWTRVTSGEYVEGFHPKVNESDRNFLVNITNVGQPFYKEGSYWLKHTDWRETDLRQGGYLKGNEHLAKPEGPLTMAEIDAVRKMPAAGVSKDNLPLVFGPVPKPGNGIHDSNLPLSGNQQYYYALADNAYRNAVEAKVKVTGMRLYATRNNAATQLKVWTLHKKMGYPVYPKGNHVVEMSENAKTYDKKNTGWIFRKLNYNYNPPAVKKQKPVE